MTGLLTYKIDRFKIWLRNIIANYLERKVNEAPRNIIRFKKPFRCFVWVVDRNWDHDYVDIKIYGLSDMTQFGYARPSDIGELGDIVKILFKVLFLGTRR